MSCITHQLQDFGESRMRLSVTDHVLGVLVHLLPNLVILDTAAGLLVRLVLSRT